MKRKVSLKKRPLQIVDLHSKICKCIDSGKYVHSEHALERQNSREIDLEDVLYVLKHGIHEKRKTTTPNTGKRWAKIDSDWDVVEGERNAHRRK